MSIFKKITVGILATALMVTSSAYPVSAETYYYYYEGSYSDEDDFFDFFNGSFFGSEASQYDGKFSSKSKSVLEGRFSDGYAEFIWNYLEGADGYKLYRQNKNTKKYKEIADVNGYTCYYTDKDIKSFSDYSYKVRAYKRSESGKLVYNKSSDAVRIHTELLSPDVGIANLGSKVTLSWKKDSGADGYEIFSCSCKKVSFDKYNMNCFTGNIENPKFDMSDMKSVGVTKKNKLTLKADSKRDNYYYVRAYANVDGERVYSGYSSLLSSSSAEAVINGKKLSPKSKVSVVGYKKGAGDWDMTISNDDKKILDKFMKENFTDDMTVYDKLEFLTDYIHYNVDYAYDYSEITNCSPVKAVFEKHTGQCYQYNGALAEAACYMGLDVRLIAGNRGHDKDDTWNHFWCEINIGGRYFVLDAGNKKDGLYNFVVPYEFADGYMYFDKVLNRSPKA